MTPKEEAKRLWQIMYDANGHEYWDVAKKCALIAVTEIKKELTWYDNPRYRHWQEVQEEIEKL